MDDVEEQEKKEKKRGFVIKEIVSTEVTYVERLRFLVEVVVVPIRETNLLDLIDQGKQFAILEKICALHSKWPFNELDSQPEKLGDFVENICSNAQLYADYLVLYEEAMARRCALLLSNRKFSDFLDKAEKDPRLQNQKIESIFILPVQRIPRYRLLLEQLLKYTPEGHAQHEMVTAALEKICAMAMYSNEAIKKRENRAKIMDIVKSIEPTTRVDLLADQDRAFIKEGPLLRQCRRGLKEFQFWLMSDQLLYGQPTPLGLYILNRQIPLSKCYVSACESMHQGGYSFIVESPAKSFIICVPSEAERDDWLHAIKQAIVALSQERHSRNAETDKQSIAPLWMPDSTASTCQKCRALFSLINRRHHCRNCGAIVCDPCSRRRYKLEHVDQRKQVRVCDGCYSFLSEDGQTSIRLASMRLAKGINPEDAQAGEEDDGLHFSDDELDAELQERANIDESDLEGFQEAMLTEGGRRSLHDQVASSDKSATFRDDGTRALPAALIQRMGKSIADVFAMRGTIAANVAGGLGMGMNSGSAKSTRSDLSDTTVSTGSYPNSPIPAFSSGGGGGRVGTSQSAYTTFNNPLSVRGGGGSSTGTGGNDSPGPNSPASPLPPPRPPRRSLFSPASPTTPMSDAESGNASPAASGPPPRRGMLLKSASAFVSSGSTFLGGFSGATSVSSTATVSSTTASSGAYSAEKDASGGEVDGGVEEASNDSGAGLERSASPAPPAKPPKPARPPRRTNVCIPPEDLLQAAQVAAVEAFEDPLTPIEERGESPVS